MARLLKLDKQLRERRRITRLLDFLKRDSLTADQMERIGRRLQKSGRQALRPLVRKLWQEKNGTAIYRYTCMLDFFDHSGWLEQLVQITLKRTDLEEEGRLALLDLLHDSGVDVTAPPFTSAGGHNTASMPGFIADCLGDGERGLVRFTDVFLDAADDVRLRMVRLLAEQERDPAELLEVLLFSDLPEVVREAALTLGRVRTGSALGVLTRAEPHLEAEYADLVRRSIKRLRFLGVTDPAESFVAVLPFHQVMAGPIDIYGSRSLWFSWQPDGTTYDGLLLLVSDTEGMINAFSYRIKSDAEYDAVMRDITSGELLAPVEAEYALALLRDSLACSRRKGYSLPADFYVDRRLFDQARLKPESYVPKFNLSHLNGIVENIPRLAAMSNELLDAPGLDGWLLSEPVIYDVAERLDRLELQQPEELADASEAELVGLCRDLIVPRRAEIIKRLLLTADYMQQTGCDDSMVQQTLATSLSLVGGLLPEQRHPFIRRLILDSIETARQALAEGYDLRLEEGYDDDRG